MSVFDITALFFALAAVFLFINTYFLKLPSSIGLTLLALVLSLAVLIIGTLHPEYHLAEHVKAYDYTELIYRFVLSAMLFAIALNIDFKALGKQLVPVMVLSLMGVIISTVTIGMLIYALTQLLSLELSLMASLVFGALISCTDPVAITKNIKKYYLSEALENKVKGESLLNGSISIVLAFTLAGIQSKQLVLGSLEGSHIFLMVIQDLIGGLIVGVLFGWLGFVILRYVDNEVVEAEMLVTLALVMTGSYLADLLGVSATLVAVVNGLILGNYGRSSEKDDPAVGAYVYRFWKLIEETLAAILFVLIGFEMLMIPFRMDYFALGFFTVLIVLFARWLAMFIPIQLLSFQHSFDKSTITVLTWGGLRGGLPVAFALSLGEFPGKGLILTITYVVVVTTVLYQGLSLGVVMRMYKRDNQWSEIA